jgi:cell volume regulation protein A
VLTGAVVGASAYYFLDVSLKEGLLLGAIVSSTDAAAVFGILRARALRLKHRLAPLLELESGSNDPTAVFLTLALTGLILNPELSLGSLAVDFFFQMGIGLAVGLAAGRVGAWLINHIRLSEDGLYPALTLSVAFASFGGAHALGGNGFLSVYVAGVALGNRNFVHRIGLLQFHDGIAWLMQIAMFLVLGLLVFPSHLIAVAAPATIVALSLVFVARPLGVFTALAFTKGFTVADRTFLSWVGLRGAVPIILATIPLTSGVTHAPLIFNVVFFVVILSVLLQGTTAASVAKWLKVGSPRETGIVERKVSSSMLEVKIPASSPAIGKQLVELELPMGTLVVLVTREGESMIPRGATQIEAGDTLLVAAPQGNADTLRQILVG